MDGYDSMLGFYLLPKTYLCFQAICLDIPVRVANFAVNTDCESLFVVPADMAAAGDLWLEVRVKYTAPGTFRVTRYNTHLTEA